ncbi:MAG: ABC transporter permease subunit, partial [Verrucomicrobiota bacterium]|nr:ABC transporter permease subunit [Verrucomicrobiota bacterium]
MRENKARARRSWGLYATMAGLYAFLGVFLIWPIFYVFHQSVWINGRFDLSFFRLMLLDESLRQSIGNSFKIAVLVTFFTTLISLPFAVALARLRFRGKSLLQGLLLVPLIMPPFVGAIGLRTILSRSGSLNTLMVDVLKIWSQPMDWFEYGLVGVVLLEILHLYPIMLLNLTAAIANIDPAMEEAASNLGAGRWRRFWSVTFPLMRPGYFAGSVIVFIWAFTDLGTPLMFDYRRVV